MTKEIVTLQVGTNANYVGAHFWNLQDEYLATPVQQRDLSPAAMLCEVSPNNRAYRSGLRYAPRLQIIDSSGAFGPLSTQAGLVLPSLPGSSTASAWAGRSQIIKHDPISHSKYIRHIHAQEATATATSTNEASEALKSPPLDDINYWTDYFKVRLHPRTCFQLPGVHHQVSNLQHFITGEQLAKPLLEDMYHDLRHFIEDCDSFGGLNMVTNADDAFSGISAAYLDHVVEELGSSLPVMIFGTHCPERNYCKQFAIAQGEQYTPADENRLSANESKLVAKSIDYSAEYIPLLSAAVHQFPNVHPEKFNMFETSGIVGLALDVALVPLRQRLSLSGMLGSIRPLPFATVGSVACNFPPSRSRFCFGQSFFDTDGSVNVSALPSGNVNTISEPKNQRDEWLRCFECISARGVNDELPIFSNISRPVTLPIPFPPVFDHLLSLGDTVPTRQTRKGVELDEIAVIAGIGTVPKQGQDMLMHLVDNLRKNVLSKHQIEENTHLNELRETLISRAEDYRNL